MVGRTHFTATYKEVSAFLAKKVSGWWLKHLDVSYAVRNQLRPKLIKAPNFNNVDSGGDSLFLRNKNNVCAFNLSNK